MKSVLSVFLFFALVSISFLSRAQQPADTLRQQANEITRKLATEISLDDARILQVRRLAYDRLLQEKEVAQLYRIDQEMRANKMRVIQEDFTTKLKEVITEAQYGRYLAQHPPILKKAVAATSTPAPAKRSSVKKPVAKPKTVAKPTATTIAHRRQS